MNLLMRTTVEAVKGQLFKAILAKLSSANMQQQAAAPVFFEKLESYVEPYVKAFPKAVNFVIAKGSFALVFMVSFFAFFSEALRQFDQLGALAPSAYLIGYFTLFALSLTGFFLVKAPEVEKRQQLDLTDSERVYTPEPSASAKSTMSDASLPIDYSNVEQLRRPTSLSAAETLLNELRSERASFFSNRI